MSRGFRAFKLKVGSHDQQRDLRRVSMLRELAGPDTLIMLDANQQWTLPEALKMCQALGAVSPYFIEEPTHPDDIQAHRKLAEAIAPIPIALGEHVPNRIVFKNLMQAGAVHVVQVDCTRVAGISEFLTVSLLARKFGLPRRYGPDPPAPGFVQSHRDGARRLVSRVHPSPAAVFCCSGAG
jgi:L-fuconate dehydratase